MNRGIQVLIGISMVLVVMTFMCVSLTSAIGDEGASVTTLLLCLGIPIVLIVLVVLFFGTMISNILRGGFSGGFWDLLGGDDRRGGRGDFGGGLGDWLDRLLGRR